MKKKLFVFAAWLVTVSVCFSQPAFYTEAPPFDNGTTQVRAPNGLSIHAYLRASQLVLATELTNIASGSTLTSFGFTLANGTSTTPVTGNFTLYLQNSSDVSYNKGTTWSTIITGMTTAYASTMTLPVSAGTTSITMTLSTPFVYNGGAIYVAYDWYSAGPFDTSPVTYRANSTGLVSGCVSGASGSSAPTTLGSSSFRPCFLWGTPNTFTNEASITGVEAQGRIAGMFNQGQVVKALVRNNSGITMNNIPVTLNVSGANTFANTQTISSLASGATSTVSFSAYTPTNGGLNTLSITVPSDQNNANNSSTYSQSVTCNEWALNPANANYTLGSVGFNTGSGIIAASYTNPTASSLTGIRVSISTANTSVGNGLWAAVLSATGGVIATTNTITLTGAMLGTFQTFTFSSPVALTAATPYYLGLAQPTGTVGYFPIGTFTSAYVPFTNYVTTTTLGGTPAPLTSNLGYFGIEAIFTPIAPTLSIVSPTVVCGTSATLAPSTTASYSWVSGPSNAGYVVTPTVNSTYSLNLLSGVGCSGSNTVAVSVNPLTVTATGAATICSGTSVSLTAAGASSYSWSSAQSGSIIAVSPSINTTYNVTGTNSAGCSNTAAVSVSVNARPVVSIGNFTICSGNTITFSPTGANSYTFTNGSATLAPITNTTIGITGTGTNGCVSSNTAISSITVNATPSISISNYTVCSGNSITLTPSGASTYTYSNGSAIISPNTNTTVSITGTGTNGCVSSNTAVSSITVIITPTFAVNNGTICLGQSFTIVPSGGTSYTIQGNSTVVSPTVNLILAVVCGPNSSCVNSNTVFCSITVNPLPLITVNSGSICSGNSFVIVPSGASTYTFSSGSATVSPTTTTSYSVTGTNSFGCSSSNAAISTVTVNATPTISVNSGSAICSGKVFTINPAGAAAYTASPTTFTTSGTNFLVSPISTTSYSFTGVSLNGCAGLNTAVCTVTVNPNPTITASAQQATMCVGESNTLSANGALLYTWGTTVSSSIVITPTSTGTQSYVVVGGNISFCTASTAVTVDVNACTGLENNFSSANLTRIYPNPGKGVINVSLSNMLENMEVKIVNTLGQEIVNSKLTSENASFNIEHEAKGLYFVYLIQDKKTVSITKVIKQ
jgi:hypothetical protein